MKLYIDGDMKILSHHVWPWLALCLSAGLLSGAWFFQYVLGYDPCLMCYWQRHAHKIVIAISLISILAMRLGWGGSRLWLGLIGFAFLGSFVVAFWHVGVEYKWWEGPKACLAATPDLGAISPEDLLKSLDQPVRLPACSEAVWHFLGLSMAGWNALISLIGAILSFIACGKANRGRANHA